MAQKTEKTEKTFEKPRQCHDCGGLLVRDTRPQNVIYKHREIPLDQPGWYCEGCGEGVLTPEDVRATDEAYRIAKAEIVGLLTPEEVSQIRKRLKLSQRKAGELLGGGARAFQKYESGQTAVSLPMSNLLRLLASDPALIERLPTYSAGRQARRRRAPS